MNKLKATTFKKMYYLGGAIYEGQKIPGVQKTPNLLRQANLFGGLKQKYKIETEDLGNISLENINKEQIIENQQQKSFHIKYLSELDCLLQKLNNTIISSLKKQQKFMLTIGGDHSIGSATIHALHSYYKDLKVIWVDAHPDFIHPQMSDYYGYHGYPAGHVCGLGKIPGFKWLVNNLPFQNIVLIGIRDIDPDQWINLKQKKIKCYTMDHVLDIGIGQVIKQSIDYLDSQGNKPFHISFDVDAVEPIDCLGTGTKFRGGLRPIQANYIIRKVAHMRKLVGLDVVEINSNLQGQQIRHAFRSEQMYGLVSESVGLGINLIESVFTQYFTL